MPEPWWRNQTNAFQAVIDAAEARGFITHDQLVQVMPQDDPDMIEDLFAMLEAKGISVVENDERT